MEPYGTDMQKIPPDEVFLVMDAFENWSKGLGLFSRGKTTYVYT